MKDCSTPKTHSQHKADTFDAFLQPCDVATYQDAMQAYKTALDAALSLNHRMPVLLDTNVLLNELNLSDEVASAFTENLKKNADHIYIPNWVLMEFERHRQKATAPFDVSLFKQLPGLTAEESETAEQEFHAFAEKGITVPGTGDLSGKPGAAHGDYIIFRELLKFMTTADTDAVFLTNDIFKGDWLSRDIQPHLRTIETVYSLTGHTLVILPAGRMVQQLFAGKTLVQPDQYADITTLYKAKFNELWVRLLETSLEPSAGRDLNALKNVKQIITLSDDITTNSYIDDSWLFMMERLAGGN